MLEDRLPRFVLSLASVLYDRTSQSAVAAEVLRFRRAIRADQERMVRQAVAREGDRLGLPEDAIDSWATIDPLDAGGLASAFAHRTAAGIPRGYTAVSSGGTTGRPKRLLVPEGQLKQRRALSQLARRDMGWRPGMPIVSLWGYDFGATASRRRRSTLKSALRGQIMVTTFSPTRHELERVSSHLASLRPAALYGYTSHLLRLGALSSQLGVELRPSTLWNGAETMDHHAAAKLSTAFGTTPRNFYGARETGAIAVSSTGWQELSVLAPWILVEVVDEFGEPVAAGASGRVLVTALHSGGTPLVRYDIGDLAVSGEPELFGRFVTSLREVTGRASDVIQTEDEKTIGHPFWAHLMKDFDCVHQYQVIIGPHEGQIELRLLGNLSVQQAQHLHRLLATELPDIEVRVSFGEPHRTARGKSPVFWHL